MALVLAQQTFEVSPTIEDADHNHVAFLDHEGDGDSATPCQSAKSGPNVIAWRPGLGKLTQCSNMIDEAVRKPRGDG